MSDKNLADQVDTPTATRRGALKSIAGIVSTGIGALTLPGIAEAAPRHVKIKNFHSGKVLEVAGAGTSNGDNVQQWEWNGKPHQKWLINGQEVGPTAQYVFIENLNSGKVLEVAGAGTSNGDNVQQWDWNHGTHQIWYIGGPLGRIKNVHSGKVLEVAGWGTHNGANVQQWEWLRNPNQKWSRPSV